MSWRPGRTFQQQLTISIDNQAVGRVKTAMLFSSELSELVDAFKEIASWVLAQALQGVMKVVDFITGNVLRGLLWFFSMIMENCYNFFHDLIWGPSSPLMVQLVATARGLVDELDPWMHWLSNVPALIPFLSMLWHCHGHARYVRKAVTAWKTGEFTFGVLDLAKFVVCDTGFVVLNTGFEKLDKFLVRHRENPNNLRNILKVYPIVVVAYCVAYIAWQWYQFRFQGTQPADPTTDRKDDKSIMEVLSAEIDDAWLPKVTIDRKTTEKIQAFRSSIAARASSIWHAPRVSSLFWSIVFWSQVVSLPTLWLAGCLSTAPSVQQKVAPNFSRLSVDGFPMGVNSSTMTTTPGTGSLENYVSLYATYPHSQHRAQQARRDGTLARQNQQSQQMPAGSHAQNKHFSPIQESAGYNIPGESSGYEDPTDSCGYDFCGVKASGYDSPGESSIYDNPGDRSAYDEIVESSVYENPADLAGYDAPGEWYVYEDPADLSAEWYVYEDPAEWYVYEDPADLSGYDATNARLPMFKPIG